MGSPYIPSTGIPKTLRCPKAHNTTGITWEVMDKAACAQELDKLLTVLRIDFLDHAHLTRRGTIIARSCITASVVVHLLKVIEGITRNSLDRDLAELMTLRKLVLG